MSFRPLCAPGYPVGAESNNIYVRHAGVKGESNAIRIGDGSTQTAAFLTGIFGASISTGDGVPVYVGSAGQRSGLRCYRGHATGWGDLHGHGGTGTVKNSNVKNVVVSCAGP